jgi:hypothetical protein
VVFRRFLALSGERKRLYVEAWWSVWAARARLWFSPRSRVRGIMGSEGASVAEAMSIEPSAAARAVEAVARFVPGATCLVKAVALRGMLTRRGTEAELRIGVNKAQHDLEAHAWVEVPGVGDFGRDGEHLEFVPFETLGAVSR